MIGVMIGFGTHTRDQWLVCSALWQGGHDPARLNVWFNDWITIDFAPHYKLTIGLTGACSAPIHAWIFGGIHGRVGLCGAFHRERANIF